MTKISFQCFRCEELNEVVVEPDPEIERLRALVAEAAEILDGDGEYPSTAKRFRDALEQGVSEETK